MRSFASFYPYAHRKRAVLGRVVGFSSDGNGEKLDLLVNTIGQYWGVQTSYFDYRDSSLLQISADGSWSVEFAPLSHMDHAENGTTFTGDNVVYIDEDSLTKLYIVNEGESNFPVKAVGMKKVDLLVNEIGGYDGTVVWNEPKSFFVVHSSGTWSFSW